MALSTIDLSKMGGTALPSSIVTASGLSTGKIGQVVHTKNTTYRVVGTSSFVEHMSVAITPSSTSSKILVLCSPHITVDTNNTACIERMYRNVGGSDLATQVLSDHTGKRGSTSGQNDIGYSASQWYDTPSTTSAITYTYNVASYANNANVIINNYHAAGSFSSQMTAMEILA